MWAYQVLNLENDFLYQWHYLQYLSTIQGSVHTFTGKTAWSFDDLLYSYQMEVYPKVVHQNTDRKTGWAENQCYSLEIYKNQIS